MKDNEDTDKVEISNTTPIYMTLVLPNGCTFVPDDPQDPGTPVTLIFQQGALFDDFGGKNERMVGALHEGALRITMFPSEATS